MKRMRCRKIMFEGYKRLAETECNVSPYLLAFVGQNESGKSSVLTGLEWLSEDDETPLPALDRSRAKRKATGWIVGPVFVLGDDEKELITPLGFAQTPTGISLFKQANGSLNIIFEHPRNPKRDPTPFTQAADALARAQQRFEKQISAAADDHDGDEVDETLEDQIAKVVERLSDPDADWEAADERAAGVLADWLDQPSPRGKNPAGRQGSNSYPNGCRDWQPPSSRTPPESTFYASESRPSCCSTMTTGSCQRSHRSTPKVACGCRRRPTNLLAIADVNITDVWKAHTAEDSGEKKTLQDAANRRLDEFFGEAWNQSNISVNVDVDQLGLLTHVVNMETRRFTRIEERSEGLRAFVTLAVFLDRKLWRCLRSCSSTKPSFIFTPMLRRTWWVGCFGRSTPPRFGTPRTLRPASQATSALASGCSNVTMI